MARVHQSTGAVLLQITIKLGKSLTFYKQVLYLNHLCNCVHYSYDPVWIGLSAPDTVTGYVWSDGSPVSYSFYFNSWVNHSWFRRLDHIDNKIRNHCVFYCLFLQLQFQHWEDGEPNNKNNVESCAEIKLNRKDRSGSWNDVHCETYNGWLCQIRAGKMREWNHFFLCCLVTKVSKKSMLLFCNPCLRLQKSYMPDFPKMSSSHLFRWTYSQLGTAYYHPSALFSVVSIFIFCLCPYRSDSGSASRPCHSW